jgi:hypothetical protein
VVMRCRTCGTQTTRKTHDGPKAGKTMWYAWWFRCAAGGWMYMPGDAVRRVEGTTRTSPAQTDAYQRQDCGDDGVAPW